MKIATMLLLFILMPLFAMSKHYSGRIAAFKDASPIYFIVDLPFVKSQTLENELLQFTNMPSNLNADQNNCFCFGENDERLS